MKSRVKKALKTKEPRNGTEIFCRYIRKNGKIIYPKGSKVFHFYV